VNNSFHGAVVVPAALAVAIVALWCLWRQRRRQVRSLESRLRAVESERAQIDRLVTAGRVAAGLAHEVGNPLCAITNYAHSLHERVPPELRGTIQSLQREIGRIERMMDGFVDYARPDSDARHGADVTAAWNETLGFLSDQGVLRRVTVEPHIDPNPMTVSATALALEQVFANLVLNAVDAMPAGGHLRISIRRRIAADLVDAPEHRVSDTVADGAPARTHAPDERLTAWVASDRSAEVVKVVVSDSGHGVKAGDEIRIFEPFVTSKSREHGTGLGLAVVKRLVRNMNGFIWVQRSREGGAAFHIVMPVQPPSVAQALNS